MRSDYDQIRIQVLRDVEDRSPDGAPIAFDAPFNHEAALARKLLAFADDRVRALERDALKLKCRRSAGSALGAERVGEDVGGWIPDVEQCQRFVAQHSVRDGQRMLGVPRAVVAEQKRHYTQLLSRVGSICVSLDRVRYRAGGTASTGQVEM
jgi:hypothetical protein